MFAFPHRDRPGIPHVREPATLDFGPDWLRAARQRQARRLEELDAQSRTRSALQRLVVGAGSLIVTALGTAALVALLEALRS